MRTIELDGEAADRITLINLQEQRDYLTEELRAHIEDGQYLHEHDVTKNHQLIYCLEKLISYFGG